MLVITNTMLLNQAKILTDNGELVVNEDASKGQLTSAFKKFSKNKKSSKVLLTNFGAAVA